MNAFTSCSAAVRAPCASSTRPYDAELHNDESVPSVARRNNRHPVRNGALGLSGKNGVWEPAAGVLRSFKFQPGDQVREGDLLVEFEETT